MPKRRPDRFSLMHERLAGGVVGAVFLPWLFLWLLAPMLPTNTAGNPLDGAATFSYSVGSVLFVAAAGLGVGALGFFLGFDRQFFNWLLVGGGAGLLLFGASYLALERVAFDQKGFSVRSAWGLSRTHVAYADLNKIWMQPHHRDWGRHRTWLSLHYQTKDGQEVTLSSQLSRTPLLLHAWPHLVRTAGAKGTASVK